jgi:hypothetical protein
MYGTLIRFVTGASIGLCLVSLFGDNTLHAMISAVVCGTIVDQVLKPKKGE